MAEDKTIKRIGRQLREESNDIVEARLPERLRVLTERLARLEKRGELKNGTRN